MKKLLLTLVASTALLQADPFQTTTPQLTPSNTESRPTLDTKTISIDSAAPKHYSYIAFGATAPVRKLEYLEATAMKVTGGQRRFLNDFSAWDYSVGLTYHPYYQIVDAHVLYLLYPLPGRGVYLGPGIGVEGFHFAGGIYGKGLNYPFTLGYQFSDKKTGFGFVQAQLSYDVVASVTLGLGF